MYYFVATKVDNDVAGFNFDVNVNNFETFVTSLLCEGQVITLEMEGDINNEFSLKYQKHNHENIDECNDNCVKTEVIQDNTQLQAKYIPIYLSHLSQSQNLFVDQFVKNSNFELYSENYFSSINFYLEGSGRLSGVLWTHECTLFNKEISASSFSGAAINENNYLQYIETSILTTVNNVDIKNNLQIPQEEATKISNLAQMHQVDLNMVAEKVALPSYETLFRGPSDNISRLNMISSKIFLQILKRQILELSQEEKKSLTTEDWLVNNGRKAKFKCEEETKLQMDFENVKITFEFEDRLNNFMTKYGSFIGREA